jgi:hypothetical protein
MQPEQQGYARREPLHPGLHTFGCESALPDPLDAESSAKTIDGSLPGARSDAVLDEKAGKPQCQKMVRWVDLIGAREGVTAPQRHCEPTGPRACMPSDCHPPRMRGIQYAEAPRLHRWRLWNTGSSAFADDDD